MSRPRPMSRLHASILLIGALGISYEIALMRALSIAQWHHFAYMIISVAMLGFAVSGTVIALLRRRIAGNERPLLAAGALALSASLTICFALSQMVPFETFRLTSEPAQLRHLLILYLILAVPFFLVSWCVALGFLIEPRRVGRLYFFNMLGSGLGAGAVVAPAAPLYDGIVVRSDLADPDQYTIDVQWSPPSFPQVDWQTATVTLSQGGVTVGTVTTSGSSAAFSVKSGDAGSGTLAPGSVADVSITLTGPDGTSPAATATVICASPTIQSVLNVQEGDPSGESVGVKVTTNAGADGQLLTVQLLADGRVVATASGLTTNTVNLPLTGPLDPSVAFTVQVRWTGNGVDDSTFGGWSAEAPVSSATTQILAARYNGTDVMFETAQALGAGVSQGVYAYAIDTRRGRVSGQVVMGNVGSFPLSGTGNWQIGAQPIVPLVGEGASNSVAPTCPTLPLLIAAPSIQSVEYDGSTVSIEFDPVNDTGGNPSTSSEVEIVIGGEPIAQFTAGSDGASIPFVMRETYVTPSVRVRAVNGPIVGPLSARMPIPTEAPTVTAVQVGASITATVTAPDGAEALACLMSGDAIVAGPDRVTEGSIEFDFDASGTSGLSIVARSMMTGFFGPYSPAVPVLGQPPEVTALAIDAPGDGTWVLTGTWNPSDDPNVTGYTMALMDGSTTVSSSNTNTMVVAQSDVDPTTSYTVTVAADGIDQARSPFTTLPVLFDAPVLTATQYDGSEVAASWAPPNSLGSVTDPQFRIALIDASGGVVRTSEVVSGVAGSVSLPESLLALGVTAVRVQVVAGVVVLDPGANGPDGTQATLQSATVGPIETVTDASSGAVVLQWGAIDGATYAIELSDGTSDTAADASYPMPTAPMPGAPLTARVSATQNSQGVANTGPWSAQSAVVTAATTITAVSWDGTNATVSWEGLEATTGTVVSVLADDGVAFQATAPPAATTLSFQPAVTDASKTYTVVVQPQVSGSTGPASEAEPLFAWGWFPSRVPATTAAPYLYPALTYAEAMSATLGTSGPDLTLYLGDVAAGGSIELPVGDGPFVLDEGSGNWPYKLTLSGDIWAFDTSPVRSGLVTALTTFLQQCETAGVVAWGVDQLLQAISRAMPQTFDELLYYAYGLTFPGNGAVHGTVDLRPGMILRVASSDYMTVSGASSSTWLPGYTGTSVMDYEVSSYTGSSGWLIGFDAFVARLIANGALSVDAPPGDIGAEAEGGLAAAADLFYPAFQQPFYRLFFPSTLLSASDEGSNQPAANFAIAACSSYTQLTTATNVPAAGNTVAYFRGRSVLEVLIRVTVNGVELTVPVGTTVGNLLDRFGCRPTSIAATLEGLELTRTRGPAVIDPDAALDPGGSTPVGLSWMGLQVYAPGIDALSMPLLHGDILTLKG